MKVTAERRAFFIGFQTWLAAQPPARQQQIRGELRRLFIERLRQLHTDTVARKLLGNIELN